MSAPRAKKRPHGQIRRSQVVTIFGPGSLLDLPNHSAIVGGLDHWFNTGEEVHEPRLIEKLRRVLDTPLLTLQAPPPDIEDPTGTTQTGITAWQFPEWFITQDARTLPGGTTRTRRLVHRQALTKSRFIDEDRQPQPVVPIRFVRACIRGHIGDINWRQFVHMEDKPCPVPILWLDERGTSGDLSEVWIRCECGQNRQIAEATRTERRPLGTCDGARPWLGKYAGEGCDQPNRLLVRTASNAYFSQTMSVISLPEKDEELGKAVDQVWEHYLKHIENIEDLRYERRKKPPVQAALQGYEDDEVYAEISRRNGGLVLAEEKTVKEAEIETLISCEDEVGNDRPDGDFFARALIDLDRTGPWMKAVERVVLVHRLREVIAQVGFTRFESSAPDVNGELEMGVSRASLAREVTWLPAVENRGEGIFPQFSTAAIEEWNRRPKVLARGRELLAGFECWKKDHDKSKKAFPTLPYIMLHSLSHLLITAVSLECGYPASSIRERVYSGPYGHGILLYTGSPDAEGTLGGLVEAGRRIDLHLRAALGLGGLCSNDPVCAQHEPANSHVCRFLHGAACHGCLLIAETSCEQFNDFLDRALVVPTVDGLGAEFFGPDDP